ncbi:NUDIX domain-containing protein [Paenisporosarcina indica]|uniref:NUDIX domain-containing protein n=1 Tax=Paenisporosarcina indica TaxID=650093 RepID=UPI00094FC7A8|nr:NUDIX hydrolase [Paenisporosarcina indica]
MNVVDPSLEFIEFIHIQEDELPAYETLAGSYAIIQVEHNTLFAFNRFRKRWELPAGKRELNESPKECASRELFEETGQRVDHLAFQGLAKIRNLETQFVKYNPIYLCNVDQLTAFIPNDEIEQITLWDLSEDIGTVDQVDLQILMATLRESHLVLDT